MKYTSFIITDCTPHQVCTITDLTKDQLKWLRVMAKEANAVVDPEVHLPDENILQYGIMNYHTFLDLARDLGYSTAIAKADAKCPINHVSTPD